MTCPHCGAKNDDTANFCKRCSAKLRAICDCWVKKEPYNCGQGMCPGYRLFLNAEAIKAPIAFSEARSQNQ